MYLKNEKRRLYWLIDQYLSGQIDEYNFCSGFHATFVNEMNYDDLSHDEYQAFFELSDVSQRFSDFKEDFDFWSGFVDAKKLREKIIETKTKLRNIVNK